MRILAWAVVVLGLLALFEWGVLPILMRLEGIQC